MALFSQRKGIRPVSKRLQRESIDSELRNKLWSALKVAVWDQWREPDRITRHLSNEKQEVEIVVDRIWLHYLKNPLDTVPSFHSRRKSAYNILRDYFFEANWWEVYDFLEFCISQVPDDWAENLRKLSNQLLESENSAYRFVGLQIVEITDDQELAAVDEALYTPVSEAKEHLQHAVRLLFHRTNPDYRNSIKESISAVESICKRLAKKEKATLGDALNELKNHVSVHPAFAVGLKSIYGYTSDAGGIRHALREDDISPTFADAKFMLVACSAFINYLTTKAAESDIMF